MLVHLSLLQEYQSLYDIPIQYILNYSGHQQSLALTLAHNVPVGDKSHGVIWLFGAYTKLVVQPLTTGK